MPRFYESRFFELLRNVPARFFRLVRETLSLRQKIVLIRQQIYFLHRCIRYKVIPNFIKDRNLEKLCGLPNRRKVLNIHMRLLRISLQNKRNELFSILQKCAYKESYCVKYLDSNFWSKIVARSKSYCNNLLDNIKRNLRNKFDNL